MPILRTAKSAKFFTNKFFHLCDKIPKLWLLCQHLFSQLCSMLVVAKFVSPLLLHLTH